MLLSILSVQLLIMALSFFTSPLQCSVAQLYSAKYGTHTKLPRQNVFFASTQTVEPILMRRSGNYKPNVWDYEFLMSLDSQYKEDTYKIKADQLKGKVRHLIDTQVGSDGTLHFIDAIQRLGVGYHYKEEIRNALYMIYINQDQWEHDDLYDASVRFRLLRQHGYNVSPDIFRRYQDEKGNLNLKACQCEDVKGILSLHEASYYGLPGENFLEEAKAFTTKILIDMKENTDLALAKKISHSLELPLHRRTSKLESRWYIDVYETEENMIPVLLDFAKLDFNIVQASYQREVVSLTRWWVELGLHKMDFFRDRILEHYFWSLGMVPEPQFGRFRVDLAKATTLVTVIDDIYDVYGSLDELVLFTDAIERWEVGAMEQLPPYMKIFYLALLNTNNDIAYAILKGQNFDITSNQKKAWVDLCKAYLVEAKWYYEGHTPTMEDYMDNALVSIAAPLMLIFSYFLTSEKITKEALDYIESLPSLIRNAGVLIRLINDLATSSDEIAKGDVPKSIQCYMREAGVTEEVAREHVKQLINETWKEMNEALLASYPFSEPFISAAPNLDRQAHCMYQFGDGHGTPDQETKDYLNSLLIEPIPTSNQTTEIQKNSRQT